MNTILLRRIKMFNKKYKKGMADAAKAYKDFGKKQENAIEAVLQEVRQGNTTISDAVQSLKGNVDNLYSYLKSKEKADLYSVYTPFDIKNLDENERLFLVGALLRLTMDKTPTEEQQNYLLSIQKYLEIKEPPFGVDLTAIENIENINVQKAIYQSVLEYLILQDGDSYDETELQQEFLDSFNLNPKNRMSIAEHVEILYSATGALGLSEKYGYVEENTVEEATKEDNPKQTTHTKDAIELAVHYVKEDTEWNAIASETEDYIVIFSQFYSRAKSKVIVISKESGTVINTFSGEKFYGYKYIYSHKNFVCFYSDREIFLYDFCSETHIVLLSDYHNYISNIIYIDENYIIFNESSKSYLLNIGSTEISEIPYMFDARIINDHIIYNDCSLKKYNMADRSVIILFDGYEKFNNASIIIDRFEICNNRLYFILRKDYVGTFMHHIYKSALFCLDFEKNNATRCIRDNLFVYDKEEKTPNYYNIQKHYRDGFIFITEPTEDIFNSQPKFNLVKFDILSEEIVPLANSCGYYETSTFGKKIETTQPATRFMFMRNGFFFKQGKTHLNYNAYVDIDNCSIKML